MTPPDPVVPTTTISPGDLHHGTHALHIFPQELWDKILDSYSDDKRTLRACVATCRTWRPTSRKFLWRSLSVHKSRTYPALLSLLISTPDLAQLIRELDIGVQGLKIARLAILVNLQRLKLTVTFSMDQGDQADKRGDPTPDWGVRLPSVTALDLKAERPDLSLSYTDSLLFCFPNISDLTIDSYSYILRKPHRDMTAPLLRLRKLVINDPSFNKQLPSILHSAVSLEHLELSTVLAKRDKWDFADRDRVDSWRMSEIFDLSRNPCLSSLHLRFTYDERDQWGDPWAHALRQVSAFHASLNHVMLHIGPSLGLVANLARPGFPRQRVP
ncbi:uncharacterized protein C8Q71DRAFT_347311 [Rhodofomes roseus]|uniref:F-box domain-containing protein n=1 Tax=Rhodofomes roseus TaxID=34475 RepID=A0ABQ8KTK4_9APHY|nr:uncharacterized protein C8Q71DRAFT_347311 [Rhodofomes roseus]KAH9841756.1 hypothetical protein C8Q71DRAFT_347311 [Rhodofomes roseus]